MRAVNREQNALVPREFVALIVFTWACTLIALALLIYIAGRA